MPLFGLRYDLRRPDFAKPSTAELVETALAQCEWADANGFASVTLSEHHGSPDGYLPSPMVFAGAVAARTRNLRLLMAALIAPLHDPIRLAEDLAVLDVISNGRVIPVVSGGYVKSEFATFGKKLEDRAAVMEEIVPLLTKAWSGEPFEYRGTTVRVTPRPVQQPRPPIFMGGASKAAARRAARHADHFIPTVPELYEVFREERKRLGKPDPGPLPAATGNGLFVADDPDEAWRRIAPHALHETNAYARWIADAGDVGPYRAVSDPDALRASGGYTVMTPEELVERARSMGPLDMVLLHPLIAGLDPELSWECLRLVETRVLPALRNGGTALRDEKGGAS
jgi:alkanesulfonate monooxygenase SsuD/methylene tetrahydromethanopterin reductase-like flavin-dependent oxidoreductase (luciferase family)